MPVSQTEALEQEVNALREQLLDVGDDVTSLAGHVKKLRQAFRVIFETTGSPVPDFLRDDRSPALQLIRGDGAR
jgi:hypothetical protein